MKQFDFENYVKNLPDCFAKDKDSNNYKILETAKLSLQDLLTNIETVLDYLEIEKATGKTLDLFGKMVNQPRGLATDAQYRLMIKSKIAQNLANGDYSSVLKALSLVFNCDPSEIHITETDKPCTVKVNRLPFGVLMNVGMSATQSSAMIKRLLPVGVALETLEFEGTFEFCDTEAEMNIDGATKGFTDTEEHMSVVEYPDAIGGYFGEVYTGDDAELPI